MKKIKLFLCVALFGVMSYGAFATYDYYTMSVDEKAFLENIEALTSDEGYPVGNCIMPIPSSDGVLMLSSDPRTTNNLYFNCPSKPIYAEWNTTGRCIEN